jgi:hypothetical protein
LFLLLTGCPNGYYSLDLLKGIHRKCLIRLLEIHKRESESRMKISNSAGLGYGRLGDLSQMGDYSCFRNVLFNGKPFAITSSFVQTMPVAGKLEFDFVSSEKPPKDAIAINDRRFLKILLKHSLLEGKHLGVALFKLEEWKAYGSAALSGRGDAPTTDRYQCSKDRAESMGLHRDEFYNHLEERTKLNQVTKEVICQPVIEKPKKPGKLVKTGGNDGSRRLSARKMSTSDILEELGSMVFVRHSFLAFFHSFLSSVRWFET